MKVLFNFGWLSYGHLPLAGELYAVIIIEHNSEVSFKNKT